MSVALMLMETSSIVCAVMRRWSTEKDPDIGIMRPVWVLNQRIFQMVFVPEGLWQVFLVLMMRIARLKIKSVLVRIFPVWIRFTDGRAIVLHETHPSNRSDLPRKKTKPV